MKRQIVIAVVFVLALIVLVVFIGRLLNPRTEKSNIDTRGLIPARIEVPAESNGFSLLLQAGKLLKVSGDEPILSVETNWDEVAAKNILATNKAAIDTMHQAWERPFLQVEAITNYPQDFDYLSQWRYLAQLAAVEARQSFYNGNEAQGFSQAMDLIRFGQRVQAADGTDLHYLIGAAIKNLGMASIRHFCDKTTLPASKLVLISDQLTNFEANQDAMRQTLKLEYATGSKMFDDMAQTAAKSSTFYFKFAYNANRSKLDLAGQIIDTMKALTNYYATGVVFIPAENTNEFFVTRLLRGNMVGTLLNEMSLGTRRGMLKVKCHENVTVRVTRVILALRAFQIVHHRPASSLQELTPDFLEQVPLDDFDGKPIRYSPSLKEVYSVGVNLVDLGGVQSTNSEESEAIFPFHF